MVTAAKESKKIVGIRGVVGIFFIVFCFMVSLVQTHEVCAESKKVSGTLEARTELSREWIRSTEFKPPTPVGEMVTISGVYSSDDSEWNNATFFSVYFIENLNFLEHSIITFEGGDQIYRKVKSKIKALNVHDWTSDHVGWFIEGTGKFKGIKGRWREKILHEMSKITTEWEVEYEIK